MKAELKGTGVLDLNRPSQKSTGKQTLSEKSQTRKENDQQDNKGNDEDEDPNINFAKNLLESLQGQAGTTGPAGNMLSMMNLPIPKAERDDA